MSTVKHALGARTQLSGAAAAINSLASATYVNAGTLTFVSSGKTPLEWIRSAVATATEEFKRRKVLAAN